MATTQTSSAPGPAVASAAFELADVQSQAAEARAALATLQRDIAVAESRLGSSRAAQLVEANEKLVIGMLNAQNEAETAARALNEVARSSEHDALTELPNRVLLLDRLANALAGAKRRGSHLALLFVDLDNFKQINDRFGHGVGDLVLKRAARCLAAAVRESDTVSRYGGDEFLVLLADVANASDAMLVADKAAAALGMPIVVGDDVLRLTASIGISLYPDDGEDAATLIDRADFAMYQRKKKKAPAVEGEAPGKPQGPEPTGSAQRRAEEYHPELSDLRMQQANEQLVLAALDAQALQSAAERAQRRQADLLAVVAHELRNPLTPLRNAAALLARPRTDERQLQRVQVIIERQVAHMSRLVSDLIDVARARTGKLRLERRVVDLNEIVGSAVESRRPAIDLRRQRLRVDIPSGRLNLLGDPDRLAQIVDNLLDNASKYTPVEGEIGLALAAAGDTCVLTVSDTGLGIAAGALTVIFEPFMQDEQATGFNSEGLGIGLSVVRELVIAHGGHVVASSAGSGLGSRFVVTLPLHRPGPVDSN